jgi:hypothetical protein
MTDCDPGQGMQESNLLLSFTKSHPQFRAPVSVLGKFLLAFASKAVLGFGPHGTHDRIFLSQVWSVGKFSVGLSSTVILGSRPCASRQQYSGSLVRLNFCLPLPRLLTCIYLRRGPYRKHQFQQFLCCFLRIRCCRNVFTEPLPSNAVSCDSIMLAFRSHVTLFHS